MTILKFEKYRITASGLASLFFITVACFLLIFGSISLTKDHVKVLHYTKTICTVRNSSWKIIRHIQFYNFIERYVASWNLDHNGYHAIGEGTKQYMYPSSALVEANKYQIHSSYPCWYDKQNANIVQWKKPTLQRAITLIICGVLSLIYTILFLLVTHRFIQEKERHDEENMITQIRVTFLK